MTKFAGHITGFKPGKSNDCCPNEMGPPATKFSGRPAVPAGELKRYPGAVADVGMGNRRLAKAKHGDGGDDGVTFGGSPSGFKNTGGVSSGRKPGGMDGKRSKAMSYGKK